MVMISTGVAVGTAVGMGVSAGTIAFVASEAKSSQVHARDLSGDNRAV